MEPGWDKEGLSTYSGNTFCFLTCVAGMEVFNFLLLILAYKPQ